jgi:hypothetical protein
LARYEVLNRIPRLDLRTAHQGSRHAHFGNRYRGFLTG